MTIMTGNSVPPDESAQTNASRDSSLIWTPCAVVPDSMNWSGRSSVPALTIDDVRPWVRFSDTGYARNLIWEGEHYEALVLCWKVGSTRPSTTTPGSVCGLTILKGRATETLYELMPCGVMAPVSSSTKSVGEYCASQDDDTPTSSPTTRRTPTS